MSAWSFLLLQEAGARPLFRPRRRHGRMETGRACHPRGGGYLCPALTMPGREPGRSFSHNTKKSNRDSIMLCVPGGVSFCFCKPETKGQKTLSSSAFGGYPPAHAGWLKSSMNIDNKIKEVAMATQEISKFFNESFGVRRAPRVIDFYLAELLRQVRSNPVVILTAGTSAGKNRRGPPERALANPGTHVWVSQPRRKAVRKNGAWVAREMGSQPGQQGGWFLAGGDGERGESSETQIHFRVDQSLLNQVISTGR